MSLSRLCSPEMSLQQVFVVADEADAVLLVGVLAHIIQIAHIGPTYVNDQILSWAGV